MPPAFDFPGAPNPGDVFTDPTSAASFTWNGYAWMGGAANSLGALIVSDTPPAAPANNSLWFESDTGMLFLRYNDGNSSQWVQLNALPNGAGYMPLQGVTDGSNAPAGQIGEVISSNVTTTVPLTASTPTNLTSIVLTAGDWDVCGEIWVTPSVTGATVAQGAINTVSATMPLSSSLATARTMIAPSSLTVINNALALRPCRANLTTPTTYYLIGMCNGQAALATGNIWARRVR